MQIFTVAFDTCKEKKLASSLHKLFEYFVFKLSSCCLKENSTGVVKIAIACGIALFCI